MFGMNGCSADDRTDTGGPANTAEMEAAGSSRGMVGCKNE